MRILVDRIRIHVDRIRTHSPANKCNILSFDFSNSEYNQYIRYGKWAELVLFRGENMIPKGGGREYIFNVNKTSSCGYR